MKNTIFEVIKNTAKADFLSEPIVGFADVNSTLIRNIREHTFDGHLMPEDILPSAKIIVSYFLPFKKEYGDTNSVGELPSDTWLNLFNDTNKIIGEVNSTLIEKINKFGFSADYYKGGFDKKIIMSEWSQRHIAESAGLGKFGLNNLLITKVGSCGRFGSVVSDISVEPDLPMTEELCIYKLNGGCRKCAKRCPVNALESGYSRKICYERCLSNEKIFGADICGKCAVDIPCAFKKI